MCALKNNGEFQRARPTLDKAPDLSSDAPEKTLDKENFNGRQWLVHMLRFVEFVWMHSCFISMHV